MNNVAESKIAIGSVSNQASRILCTVLACRFLMPLLATIDPAIPDESAWVVLTGNVYQEARPIVVAATSSADAPWA